MLKQLVGAAQVDVTSGNAIVIAIAGVCSALFTFLGYWIKSRDKREIHLSEQSAEYIDRMLKDNEQMHSRIDEMSREITDLKIANSELRSHNHLLQAELMQARAAAEVHAREIEILRQQIIALAPHS